MDKYQYNLTKIQKSDQHHSKNHPNLIKAQIKEAQILEGQCIQNMIT